MLTMLDALINQQSVVYSNQQYSSFDYPEFCILFIPVMLVFLLLLLVSVFPLAIVIRGWWSAVSNIWGTNLKHKLQTRLLS